MTKPTENQLALVGLAYSRSKDSLQAQSVIASAADQRALVFSTLSIAAAALVYGALNQHGEATSAIGTSVFFCLSSLSAAISALPGRLHGFTSKYNEMSNSVEFDRPLEEVLVGLCANNDEYLDLNERSASWRAHFYRFAVFVFLFGACWSLVGFTLN